MPRARLELEGFPKLVKLVRDIEARGGNLQGVAEFLAEELVTAAEQNFQTESGHRQGRWFGLAESTRRRRRASGSIKILQDTGAMAGSMQPAHSGLVAEAYTNDPKAKFHVSHAPRRVIPLRDFLDVDFDGIAELGCEVLLAEMVP